VIEALRSAQTPKITVVLAGQATDIRFVQVHLNDLRAILSVIFEDIGIRAEANADAS
jgi:hypothetical protein